MTFILWRGLITRRKLEVRLNAEAIRLVRTTDVKKDGYYLESSADILQHDYAMRNPPDTKQRDIKMLGLSKDVLPILHAYLPTWRRRRVTTCVGLDKLAIKCEYSRDIILPGCEAQLRTGDRKNYISKVVFKDVNPFGCSECDHSFTNDSGLAWNSRRTTRSPTSAQESNENMQT